MRWLYLLVLGLALVACGGNGDSAATPAAETPNPTSPATGQTPESAATPPAASSSGAAAAVRYSGAAEGEVTDRGTCAQTSDELQIILTAYDAGEDLTWMLRVAIRDYDGPGDYDVGDSLLAGSGVTFNDTSVTFANNDGGEWGSHRDHGGTVSVEAGETSGSLDATLVSPDGESELQIAGTWTCS